MKTFLIGANGMLGKDWSAEMARRGWRVEEADIANLDITDQDAVYQTIERLRPEIVCHSAAFTAVDACETESEKAFRVNRDGTQHIAQACSRWDIPMIYISTDYVFNGKRLEPYCESDPPDPISVYGRSKLEGEKWVGEDGEKNAIVRTSWLFGLNGPNFVETVLRLGRTGQPMRMVNDQTGSPTYTVDLAAGLCDLMEKRGTGIFHLTNDGPTTWYGLAQTILKYAGLECELKPISSLELARPALRPANSRLENRRAAKLGVGPLRSWQDALAAYLQARARTGPRV